MEVSEIQKFYKDTKIFITGATGFVGKTLIEKLLRVMEVDTIYILIREKKGKIVEERINKMFDNPLFDVVKYHKPNYRSKIKAIMGECGTEGLTVSEKDKEELKANVNIIFHSAATVNFNENLKTAYEINVKGTKAVIDIAKEMPKLKAMVYVSSAFSNSNLDSVIEEKVYDYSFNDAVVQIEKSTKEDLEILTEKIIGKWPNTYTFTKAISEVLVKNEGKNLPFGIFRPSIIVSTYKEPIPGWIDNIYGINGITVGIMTGFLKVILSRVDTIIDAVPIDKCISALVVSAWEIAENGKIENDKNIRVYNYTSGRENPLTNGLLKHLNFAHGVPSLKLIWAPCAFFVTNEVIFWFLSVILEIIPALCMDMIAIVTGNKPRLVSLYIKVLNFMSKVKFFGLREWEFDNKNIQALWNKLNKTDQELFPFSMSSMSWLIFSKTYLLGQRRYILKEDDSSLPQAKAKMNRFIIAQYVLKAVAIYMVYYILNIILSKMYNTVMT